MHSALKYQYLLRPIYWDNSLQSTWANSKTCPERSSRPRTGTWLLRKLSSKEDLALSRGEDDGNKLWSWGFVILLDGIIGILGWTWMFCWSCWGIEFKCDMRYVDNEELFKKGDTVGYDATGVERLWPALRENPAVISAGDIWIKLFLPTWNTNGPKLSLIPEIEEDFYLDSRYTHPGSSCTSPLYLKYKIQND